MTKRYADLTPTRDKLAQSLANEPGFDSVGITKEKGELTLSVLLAEPGYSTARIPTSYNGYPVVKKRATDFIRMLRPFRTKPAWRFFA
jgi:hypothetical protein